MHSGMTKKERQAAVEAIEVKWGMMEVMTDDQLRSYINNEFEEDERPTAKKLAAMNKQQLLRRIIMHNVRKMI